MDCKKAVISNLSDEVPFFFPFLFGEETWFSLLWVLVCEYCRCHLSTRHHGSLVMAKSTLIFFYLGEHRITHRAWSDYTAKVDFSTINYLWWEYIVNDLCNTMICDCNSNFLIYSWESLHVLRLSRSNCCGVRPGRFIWYTLSFSFVLSFCLSPFLFFNIESIFWFNVN